MRWLTSFYTVFEDALNAKKDFKTEKRFIDDLKLLVIKALPRHRREKWIKG